MIHTTGLDTLPEADLPVFVEALKIVNSITSRFPERDITIDLANFEIRLHGSRPEYYLVVARAYVAPPGHSTATIWVGGDRMK